MSPDPEFLVRPPLRCFGRHHFHRGQVCGARASWMRPSLHGGPASFFCDFHRGKLDVPIADDVLFRRVTVTLDVVLAAVDILPAGAAAEALLRLEELLESTGALPCVHGIVQQVGRMAPIRRSEARALGKRNGQEVQG